MSGQSRFPRHRPPWWPEDEPFPPHRAMGAPARKMRRHFMRRMALVFLSFVLLAALGVTLLFSFVASVLGLIGPGGMFGQAAVLLALASVLAFTLIVGAARRVAAPIGDLIEAAGKVEAGEYGTRVEEHGPREVRGLARAFNAMAARLETSEERRRRLLADVTHELRSPLTIVQGNLEALLDGVYPADPEHLAPILEETRVLSRLVDDLRTLSLAEAGTLTLHREPTDLAAMVRETLASFRAQADRAEVALDADVEGEIPIVEVDPVRTREVLANLLGNALRYTLAGGTIRVRLEGDRDRVRVAVRDTGAGISPEALAHVFDRFYKSEESSGAGLGLAIAKSLVVAHGGEIVASSTAGQGTEIRFTLPLHHVA